MTVTPYPKIPSHSKRTQNLFDTEVEITEKIDGSAFAFRFDEHGNLLCRSRSRDLNFPAGAYTGMFSLIVQYLERHKEDLFFKLGTNHTVYGEFLSKPKHNVILYKTVPKNNLMVYGVTNKGNWIKDHEIVKHIAGLCGFDTVPLLFKGVTTAKEVRENLLGKESCLGGAIAEGVVVKNYECSYKWEDKVYTTPVFAKFVTDAFKEKHQGEGGSASMSGKDALYAITSMYRTEARFDKAIQRLRERGELTGTPKDIGPLIRDLQNDLLQEEADSIRDALYALFIDNFKKEAARGLPEYYKAQLEAEAEEK